MIVPFLFFVSRPLQTERQETLNVIGPGALQASAGSGDVMIDQSLGFLLLRSFDCQGELTPGRRHLERRRGGAVQLRRWLCPTWVVT